MESPATKRLRTAAKSSILSQPESKSVGPTKKKVTFDPNLLQCDKDEASKTIQPATKSVSLKETADIVVKYLTPFYKGGKFASKVGTAQDPFKQKETASPQGSGALRRDQWYGYHI